MINLKRSHLSLKLAWKFLQRELSQGDLSLLFIAIFIAISSLSSIGFLLKRIDRSMLSHAAQLNGAELLLKSPTAVPENWLRQAKKTGLKQAQMVSFPSMLVVNEHFKLAQIKAVSSSFPLLGKLMVKPTIEQPAQKRNAPVAGDIWLDRRLYHYFKSSSDHTDSHIELGEAIFNANGILDSVPGQSSTLFNIAPTAIINLADLNKTATVQAGSRVDYIYFFSGTEQALTDYRSWLKNKISPGQNLRYGVEGVRAVSANIEKASDFLSLAALLTVLLSAIAITISSHHYGQKQYKNNAVLLCLGFTERFIIQIELLKLILLGFFASMLGVICGYLIHLLLLEILSELIPKPLPQLSLLPVWMGLGSGILLIVTISIANLFRLKQLSPMAILRKDFIPASINHYLLYGSSLLALLLLSWFYTQNMTISLLFYALIFTAMLILFVFAQLLLKTLFKLNKHFKFVPKLSIINLQQHKQMSLLQISTFSLIFALVLIIYLTRSELLYQWQQQLPADTPNHFVINIQAYETDDFKQMLVTNNIQASDIFPMVRGRLSILNNRPIKESIALDKQSHNALNRELNLSFAAKMQSHNKLVKGKWWDSPSPKSLNDLPEISLESSLAKELNIKIGDQLGFQIGSRQVQGVVSNLREVKWDSFKPNFYIIFPPQVLEQFPLTYISSFHLKEQNKLLLNQLIEQFPGITIIEVDQILKEIHYIIEKIAIAINFVFVFILIAGLLVLASSLSSTLESRMYENAIIRTLGASAKRLRFSLMIEFSIIALISALMGLIIAEAVSAILYQQIFNLSYSFHPWLWLVVLIMSVLLITGLGLLLVNKIFTRSVDYSLKRFGT
ncbi:MAG: FtsX-like permease family protein [Pseudomonadota bacterium]